MKTSIYGKSAVILLILLTLFSACKKAEKKPEIAVIGEFTPWFPLYTGNRWVYNGDFGDTKKGEIIYEVTGTEKINDVECHVLEMNPGSKENQKEYLEVRKDGVYSHQRSIFGEDITMEPAQPILKLPPKKGTAWTWESLISGDVKVKVSYRIDGLEKITVPAGKFKTVRITVESTATDRTTATSTRWYAEKVGIVKEIIKGSKISGRMELKNFREFHHPDTSPSADKKGGEKADNGKEGKKP